MPPSISRNWPGVPRTVKTPVELPALARGEGPVCNWRRRSRNQTLSLACPCLGKVWRTVSKILGRSELARRRLSLTHSGGRGMLAGDGEGERAQDDRDTCTGGEDRRKWYAGIAQRAHTEGGNTVAGQIAGEEPSGHRVCYCWERLLPEADGQRRQCRASESRQGEGKHTGHRRVRRQGSDQQE